MLGMLAAMVLAVVLMARHGAAARKMAIPFGPFLAFGAIVALFWGQEILDAVPLRSSRSSQYLISGIRPLEPIPEV